MTHQEIKDFIIDMVYGWHTLDPQTILKHYLLNKYLYTINKVHTVFYSIECVNQCNIDL